MLPYSKMSTVQIWKAAATGSWRDAGISFRFPPKMQLAARTCLNASVAADLPRNRLQLEVHVNPRGAMSQALLHPTAEDLAADFNSCAGFLYRLEDS